MVARIWRGGTSAEEADAYVEYLSRTHAVHPARRARLTGARIQVGVNSVVVILLVAFVVLPVVIVGVLFVWAAFKDGQEDKALQARLGIRRRTRLGR